MGMQSNYSPNTALSLSLSKNNKDLNLPPHEFSAGQNPSVITSDSLHDHFKRASNSLTTTYQARLRTTRSHPGKGTPLLPLMDGRRSRSSSAPSQPQGSSSLRPVLR